MRIIVEVTPSRFTTADDLALAENNIRLTVNDAVDAIAVGMFPEYKFTVTTEPNCCEPPF